VVVEKRVVPKERVRLAKDTVTDEQQVTEQLRKERIDVDDPTRRP
jgi:stress response protein YsnF